MFEQRTLCSKKELKTHFRMSSPAGLRSYGISCDWILVNSIRRPRTPYPGTNHEVPIGKQIIFKQESRVVIWHSAAVLFGFIQGLSTKDSRFFTDSKYSADYGPLPHISAGHVCKPLNYRAYRVQWCKQQSIGAERKRRGKRAAKKSDKRSGAVSGLNVPLVAAKACCPVYSLYSAVHSAVFRIQLSLQSIYTYIHT